MIGLLTSRSFDDVTGFEGKALLKQDISERISALLTKGKVKAVLFTEFVVQ
ncbi:flagellar basal body-associated protein FliL [compost metagenome]